MKPSFEWRELKNKTYGMEKKRSIYLLSNYTCLYTIVKMNVVENTDSISNGMVWEIWNEEFPGKIKIKI